MKTERYTPEQVITALERSRGIISIAARALGCSGQTVRNYVARYPAVQEVLDEQRDYLLDITELALMTAVHRGEPWAIRLVLSTLGKERGYTTRVEAAGKGSTPLNAPIIYIPQEDPLPGATARLPSSPDDDEADDAA